MAVARSIGAMREASECWRARASVENGVGEVESSRGELQWRDGVSGELHRDQQWLRRTGEERLGFGEPTARALNRGGRVGVRGEFRVGNASPPVYDGNVVGELCSAN